MAQKVQTLFVDDLDGSEAEGTVRFGLDGTEYEIDLNAKHATQLRDALYYICCFSLCERAAAQRGTWFTWSGYMPSPPSGRRGSSGEAGAVVGPARAGLVAAAPV